MSRLTQEKKWAPSERLTPKENRFVEHVVNNPKDSFTEAAVQAYNVKSRAVAANIARQLRDKPHVVAELERYSTNAEHNLIRLADASTDFAMAGGKDGAAYAGVAERTNNSILDRIHGKSTQKSETTVVAVQLNVDLSAAS